MTTIAYSTYKPRQKKLTWADIERLVDLRRKNRLTYEMIERSMPIISAEIPNTLFHLHRRPMRGWMLDVTRNSIPAKKYATCAYVPDKEEWFINQYKGRDTKPTKYTKESKSLGELISNLREIIKKEDRADGYLALKDNRKLINVVSKKDGTITITIMLRDKKGKFLPKPVVEKNHTTFTMYDFIVLFQSSVFACRIWSKETKAMMTVKGKLVEFTPTSIGVK